jgi:signal transduction histidine kinase
VQVLSRYYAVNFMSLRLRLSLLYSAILALTLIVFGMGVYFALSQITYQNLKSTLASEAKDEAERVLQYSNNNGILRFPPRGVNWKYRTDVPYMQLCEPDGRVVDHIGNGVATEPLLPQTQLDAENSTSFVTPMPTNDGRLLVYSYPIIAKDGQPIGIVLAAQSLNGVDRTLGLLRNALVLGGSVVTLSAFGVGWVLSGTALRPINRLTATARRIGRERNFGRRVDYNGPPDEVGRLATTFNTMLTELQAAYAQVEHALQAQRRFVADASHELRTPLTTIRGNLGLLQRQPPISPADRDAVLADMVDETERMSRLVNDLLVLARTDAGRPLRSEPVSLKPLVDEMCRTAHALSTTHTIVCANDLDVAACGDEDALKQVVLILLDNALRYTPAHGTVTLATGVTGEHVTISVRDTGSGIPPDLLPHIFERFRRGDVARSGTGTGLGLSIAKALVDAQGGTIMVDSSQGHGSVFTVTLPRATA